MIYKRFKSLSLSALGMGAMRLPTAPGDDAAIDEEATARMVDYALRHGVNYYDTAWGYHNGYSEAVMGNILSQYPRGSFYLATKFPGYDLNNMDSVKNIFEKQLEKCRVDYFDFYMLHNVCEMNIEAYLNKQYGIMDYLSKQKEAGRIRLLGFSTHGGHDVMKRFLEAYSDCMEFCQIQLNYLDWTFQNAKAKVGLLSEYHIPVWVMEPMRGGRLAALSGEHAAALKALRPDEKPPAWAFRFLQTIPQVTVTLSGMSDMQQLRDNINTYETEKPLNARELDALLRVVDDMLKRKSLPCTACRYCSGHCPRQLDIPALIELYNEHCFTSDGGLLAFIAPMALAAMPADKRPDACLGCGGCEAVCPQGIRVSEAMADFASKLHM